MITAAKLKTRTVKDLAAMAKKKRVPGWHAMRKDELVRALVKQAKAAAARRNGTKTGPRSATKAKATAKPRATAVNGRSSNGTAKGSNGTAKGSAPKRNGVAKANGKAANGKAKQLSPYAQRRLKQVKAKRAASKDLAIRSVPDSGGSKDRLVVMVRDPFWLHAYWELSRAAIDRARAAMGQHWHGAKPVLRLYKVSRNGTTNTARGVVRDVEIHGGVNNWYVDVQDPPQSFQMDIGYLADGGRFHSLARSNTVTTPRASQGDSFDQNWAEVAKDFDRIYAMSGGYLDQESNGELKEVFEERLKRPMGGPMATRFGLGASARDDQERQFNFKVDTELIVHGVTEPDAHVTLRGEPIHLRNDGSFAVRLTLPNRRHVLPVVASTGDGVEQRTIVLAVDRNTKVMEPVIRDPGT